MDSIADYYYGKNSEIAGFGKDYLGYNISVIRTLFKTFTLPLILVLGLAGLCYFKEIPPTVFTEDPAGMTDAYPWIGLVSYVGILVWFAGASICFFTAAVLSEIKHDKELIRFLLAGGIMTTLLTLDDLFMLHEYIYPDFLHVPQKVVVCIYAAGMLWYLVSFRVLILKKEPLLFILGLVLFGLSTAVDMFLEVKNHWLWYAEDVCKFLGICSWSAYYACFSFKALVGPRSSQPVKIK